MHNSMKSYRGLQDHYTHTHTHTHTHTDIYKALSVKASQIQLSCVKAIFDKIKFY